MKVQHVHLGSFECEPCRLAVPVAYSPALPTRKAECPGCGQAMKWVFQREIPVRMQGVEPTTQEEPCCPTCNAPMLTMPNGWRCSNNGCGTRVG